MFEIPKIAIFFVCRTTPVVEVVARRCCDRSNLSRYPERKIIFRNQAYHSLSRRSFILEIDVFSDILRNDSIIYLIG